MEAGKEVRKGWGLRQPGRKDVIALPKVPGEVKLQG